MSKQEEITTVTYNFANGSKVVQPITESAMYDEKGRKRDINALKKLFAETAFDKGAVNFNLEAKETEQVNNIKEIHFDKKERQNAKKDYKEYKKVNPNGFIQQKLAFTKQFVDKLSQVKKLRFNLVQFSTT